MKERSSGGPVRSGSIWFADCIRWDNLLLVVYIPLSNSAVVDLWTDVVQMICYLDILNAPSRPVRGRKSYHYSILNKFSTIS